MIEQLSANEFKFGVLVLPLLNNGQDLSHHQMPIQDLAKRSGYMVQFRQSENLLLLRLFDGSLIHYPINAFKFMRIIGHTEKAWLNGAAMLPEDDVGHTFIVNNIPKQGFFA